MGDGGFGSYETESDPTRAQYEAFEKICSYFSDHLFEARLPKPLLVLNRRLKAPSHFASKEWWARDDAGKRVSEIGLNPDVLQTMTERQVAASLVHELTHLWQDTFGRPSRAGYHNMEWSKKMEAIGLMPTETGSPTGARVGEAMRQMVIPHGRFERVFASMPCRLPFLSADLEEKKKDTSKSKFRCPGCGDVARGKPSLMIACLKCENTPFDLEEQEEGGAGVHEATH